LVSGGPRERLLAGALPEAVRIAYSTSSQIRYSVQREKGLD